jgi:hypothetical protein
VALLASDLEKFRSLPDQQPVVRQSLGVRHARILSSSEVEVTIGLSVNEVAGQAGAYRIVSEDDGQYAYARFVTPSSASFREEVEAQGVSGAPFRSFKRTMVTLRLPMPLKSGATYTVIGQGLGQSMVTGTHTAADFSCPHGIKTLADDVHQAVIGLRNISPVGNGILQIDFGPGFSPDAGKNVRAYHITVNDKTASVRNIGRITRVEAYVPSGWPFTAIPQHEVFLEVDPWFRENDRIRIEVNPEVTSGLRGATLTFKERSSFSTALKVNQVGYLTDSPIKAAYLGRWMGSFPEETESAGASKSGEQDVSKSALSFRDAPLFKLCDETSGREVFSGTSRMIHKSGQMNEGVYSVDHSGENVYLLDFTAFKQPGRYFISVPGVGRSVSFAIGPDVYAEAFRVQAAGVFIQRCGIELGPPYTPWRRVACHNTGVVPTAVDRRVGESNAFDVLPKQVDYSGLATVPRPASLKPLDEDPALVAYWRLDGDLQDASKHGRDLVPRRQGLTFEDSRELMPGHNQSLGPTVANQANGAGTPKLPLSVKTGATLSLWLRFAGGNKFDGTLLGSAENDVNVPRLQIAANWGFLRGFAGSRGESADIGRFEDGRWHHLALVAEAHETGGAVKAYVDGAFACAGTLGGGEFADGEFQVGALAGDESAGKFIDEVRVYGRSLAPEEIRILATRWGENAISLKIFGGHHDAGDYNPRSHLDVAQVLLNAYEMAPEKFTDGQLNIPERNNGIPDILDEAFWAMRLWNGLQDADGGVRGGTESNGDPNFIQTVELDRLGDYAFAKDAASSFEFAGAFAQAGRIAKSLGRDKMSESLIDRARRAYAWAAAHPPAHADTPAQWSQRFLAPKAYAAAHLYRATAESKYHNDFRETCVWTEKPDADVDADGAYDQEAAALAYALCPDNLADVALRKSVRDAVVRKADLFIRHSSSMAYGFVRHPWAPINWGTGAYHNWLEPVMWAYRITRDEDYRLWMIRTCDNSLGANPLGRSYIVGLGARSVWGSLHNSRYGARGEVADGCQVQGPHFRGEGYRVAETAYPKLREDFAVLYTYADAHFAISMDEGVSRSMSRSMAAFGLLLPDTANRENAAGK